MKLAKILRKKEDHELGKSEKHNPDRDERHVLFYCKYGRNRNIKIVDKLLNKTSYVNLPKIGKIILMKKYKCES